MKTELIRIAIYAATVPLLVVLAVVSIATDIYLEGA